MIALVFVLLSAAVLAHDPPVNARPRRDLTPGATTRAVDASHVRETICDPRWHTRTVRPPTSYTDRLKRAQMVSYGYTVHTAQCVDGTDNPACYEEDHLIPLVLGGAPTDPHNLWPQPWFGPWSAAEKDRLEVALHRLVCRGDLALDVAQAAIADDWIAAYQRYVQP